MRISCENYGSTNSWRAGRLSKRQSRPVRYLGTEWGNGVPLALHQRYLVLREYEYVRLVKIRRNIPLRRFHMTASSDHPPPATAHDGRPAQGGIATQHSRTPCSPSVATSVRGRRAEASHALITTVVPAGACLLPHIRTRRYHSIVDDVPSPVAARFGARTGLIA